jgi:hypothetical protein
MKANRVITSLFGVAAVAGLASWLAFEHQARLRLGEDHRTLKHQLNQMADLIAENEQLSNLLARASHPQSLSDDQSRELLRLRGEVGVLRQQSRELEAVRDENRKARTALASSLKNQNAGTTKAAATADYWPRDSWTFTGYASPDAALQSLFWAGNNGDLTTMLASTTGDARKEIEAQYGNKSESEASIRAMDDISGLKSIRVLNREIQSDDTVVLTATFEDRNETNTGKLLMKKIGNEWKFSGEAH